MAMQAYVWIMPSFFKAAFRHNDQTMNCLWKECVRKLLDSLPPPSPKGKMSMTS